MQTTIFYVLQKLLIYNMAVRIATKKLIRTEEDVLTASAAVAAAVEYESSIVSSCAVVGSNPSSD